MWDDGMSNSYTALLKRLLPVGCVITYQLHMGCMVFCGEEALYRA